MPRFTMGRPDSISYKPDPSGSAIGTFTYYWEFGGEFAGWGGGVGVFFSGRLLAFLPSGDSTNRPSEKARIALAHHRKPASPCETRLAYLFALRLCVA